MNLPRLYRVTAQLNRIPRSLRAKLLLSYLLVIAVGALTVIAVILLSGPILTNSFVDPSSGPLDEAVQAALLNVMLIVVSAASVLAALSAVLTAIVVSRQLTAPIHDLARASRLLAAGNYRTRVVVTAEDELGELADNFNTLAEALETTEERRLRLIGDVAHELRTPLAILQGNMEGLLDGVVAPSPALWAQLHSDAGRLRRLVDDLQQLSRVEARLLPLRPARLDSNTVVVRATERLRAQFDDAGIALRVDCPSALPPVFADADRTMQVLVNLLGNALRYTPAGGTVTLSTRAQGTDVVFVVADTGIGVAPEHLPHLFERFYRPDPSRSRALGGSGIGLTIARALIEGQGGTIGIASDGPGEGTTVSFTLPQARPHLRS